MKKNGIIPGDLKYGEAYRTTKQFTWSNFDKKMARTLVPANELLLFRCFKPYKKGLELALFVWLEKKTTICLSVEEKRSVLFVKHMEWDKRHEKLDLTEREDDTIKTKIQKEENLGEDSKSNGGESLDP